MLSRGGRLMLLKSVLCSLPTYLFSFFLVPKSVAQKIEELYRNFFWGHTRTGKKIHWVKWEAICQSKKEGGLVLEMSWIITEA